MIVKMSKFGEMLISRPAGREAYLSAKAYILPKNTQQIELDFTGIKVLTPSWIDEFVTLLKIDYPKIQIKYGKSNNPTVASSLKMI